MKISLAHDSFTQIGGAERLFEAVREMYSSSEIYTVVVDEKIAFRYSGWKIHTTFIQKIYNVYPRFQHLFPFIPIALKFFKIKQTDILFSLSSSYAKGFKKPKGSLHINYCHTPTRFIWTDRKYAENEISFILRPLAKLYFKWLARWDVKAASRVDLFIANSHEVQKRIKKYYNRNSVVIYPFVDLAFWKCTKSKADYFLIAGRLQPHKNNEVVVRLFNKLGIELHVVGTGRQEQYLRSIAQSNIKFLGRVSDEQLRDEYSAAQAFIYPPFEDFGMMSLEAAACGTATIGLGQGGILETIIPGRTGELFSEPTEQHIGAIVQSWDSNKYNLNMLREHAIKFSKENFQKNIRDFVKSAYENSN